MTVAVTVTVVAVPTGSVVRVKVVVVAPAGIVTVAGTVPTAVLLELRATTKPPVGAGLEIVTVPVEVTPPSTVVGEKERLTAVGAVIARGAVTFEPFRDAEMFAVALADTATVVTVNVAVVDPAGTVTVAGTVADALSDARVTE